MNDDSSHLELTQLVEDQKREEIHARQERNLRQALFVSPALMLLFGVVLMPRFWCLPMSVPVVAALWGVPFKDSEDRFHALFWGNTLALGFYCLFERLGSTMPVP